MSVTIVIRKDSEERWVALNPIPFQGELCLNTSNKKIKCGDGFNNWSDLPYLNDKDIEDLKNEYGNETDFLSSYEHYKINP